MALSKTAAARMVAKTKLTAGKDQPCSLTTHSCGDMSGRRPLKRKMRKGEDKTRPRHH